MTTIKYEYYDSPVHKLGARATDDIKKGEVLATEPVFCFPDTYEDAMQTFKNYIWNGTAFLFNFNAHSFLVSGLGSFVNHSESSNIYMRLVQSPVGNSFAEVFALRDISKGEELFHNYGERWWEKREKTKKTTRSAPHPAPRKRGRPKGSKNKKGNQQ
jgi:hypothetical protein